MKHVIMLVVLVLGLSFTSSSEAQPAYQADPFYIYVSQDESGGVSIRKLTANASEVTSELIQTFAVEHSMVDAFLSPSREWVTILSSNEEYPNQNSIELLYLINLKSGESISLDANIAFPHDLFDREFLIHAGDFSKYQDRSQQVAWSSDSSFVAYIADKDNGTNEVHIYKLNERTNVILSNNDARFDRIFALNEPGTFATITQECNTCEASLEIYDISSLEKLNSYSIGHIPVEQFGVCGLEASPDNQYVAFTQDCVYTYFALETRKDIFLINLPMSSLESVTEFTLDGIHPPEAPPSISYRFGVYRSEWLSDNSLLIGATFLENSVDNIQSQILAYDPETDMLTVVLDNIMAQEWAIRNSNIAFVNVEIAQIAYQYEIVNAQVNIAQIDNDQMNITHDFQGGCYLDWSNDGQMLAFGRSSTKEYSDCLLNPTQIVFANVSDGSEVAYDLQPYKRIIPLGWVDG